LKENTAECLRKVGIEPIVDPKEFFFCTIRKLYNGSLEINNPNNKYTQAFLKEKEIFEKEIDFNDFYSSENSRNNFLLLLGAQILEEERNRYFLGIKNNRDVTKEESGIDLMNCGFSELYREQDRYNHKATILVHTLLYKRDKRIAEVQRMAYPWEKSYNDSSVRFVFDEEKGGGRDFYRTQPRNLDKLVLEEEFVKFAIERSIKKVA
jgi:hypothetical protein